MNANYKVRCSRCGAETTLSERWGYGRRGEKGSQQYIETEIPIRCPVCLGRLNSSEEAFRKQIFPKGRVA